MFVNQLEPGTTFRVELSPGVNLDYRLIHVNHCRAFVEQINRGRREIKGSDGEVLAEFEDRSGRVNIAPMTVVTQVLGASSSAPSQREGVTMKTTTLKRGERVCEAGPAGRPVRPNTVRAKLIALLLEDPTGETDIKAVMKAMEMDRNLVVAHIHEAHKQHGYGYSVIGDTVTLTEPLPASEVGLEDLL